MGPRRCKKPMYLSLCVLAVCFLFLSWSLSLLYKAPMVPVHNAPVLVLVEQNTSALGFAQLLKQRHLIRSRGVFLVLIRTLGLSQRLKAGLYQVKPGESAVQFLHRVVSGDMLRQRFRIIAGTTQIKIAQDLAQAPYLKYRPEDWSVVLSAYPKAEGMLLADTYQYYWGSTGKVLLKQAHKNLLNYLNASWLNRAAHLPYKNAYELLIAASIIEKESALQEERKLISGVVVNRLKRGMPLQMDPTVLYALGPYHKGKLLHDDLHIDSAYNTYRFKGLPPTPIATVGKEAIDAAAHPQISDYLYYVAKGDGRHQFSQTYEQQRKAIQLYQRKEIYERPSGEITQH